jgi:hypothetical protein
MNERWNWLYFDTLEEAIAAADSAYKEAGDPAMLPTVFQTTTGQYTYGLTGWHVFLATMHHWPIRGLWFLDGWRESFCSPPWETITHA